MLRPLRPPAQTRHCPFHGEPAGAGDSSSTGSSFQRRWTSTAVVERNYLKYDEKYERYEKRTSRYSVHNPPCLEVKAGDEVKIMECRPLSKTVSFVIVEKR